MEFIINIVNIIKDNADVILQFVGAFAALATVTPNKTDDKVVQFILSTINTLGLNIGQSSNKDE